MSVNVRAACVARRRWLRHVGSCAVGASLAGCGFRLRQPPNLVYRRIALIGFEARSPMAEALRSALPADIAVQDTPAGAEVVITVLQDRYYRTVAASTTAGQVRELQLRVLLRYRLTTPEGHMLVSDTQLEQTRNLSYSESWALAKSTEETALAREMRNDIAAQLLRVLDTTSRQSQVPPP